VSEVAEIKKGEFALVLIDSDLRRMLKQLREAKRATIVVVVSKVSDSQVSFERTLEFPKYVKKEV
jgi:hypothetical protein